MRSRRQVHIRGMLNVRARAVFGAAIGVALSIGAAAQGPPPAVRSPEVLADRRVTFRLRAPTAARVAKRLAIRLEIPGSESES